MLKEFCYIDRNAIKIIKKVFVQYLSNANYSLLETFCFYLFLFMYLIIHKCITKNKNKYPLIVFRYIK
jgi:hypothetical protein